jgi:hypothetical protein
LQSIADLPRILPPGRDQRRYLRRDLIHAPPIDPLISPEKNILPIPQLEARQALEYIISFHIIKLSDI